MHGSEHKDGEHSTPEPDPRSQLWPRVLFSLALFGMLVGLMIGRMTAPEPRVLEQVEVLEAGLNLWFNEEPKLHGEEVEGTLALLFEAEGKAARGQLQVQGKPVSWRVQHSDGGLLVTLVAARPLHGEWSGAEEDGRWRVQVKLRE
ncbi:hypothetical protein [Pseudomonas rubra]|uniref:Cytochrome oxidase complex assembly protein 1 n=1 Tax=Pseudomonas rubra TaxID=2942627 RepID=A0ABT5P6V0_9PSED|nr:hypothetical protein [Pseudomonas rubra]MDD1014024.1 hypothetical protein [Pseudomonas rubra]MDD1038958.1 hypothetical protein [Pseudomonas rubra]MDD1154288.1 hypothetical protein [Pseudomonas rubra]